MSANIWLKIPKTDLQQNFVHPLSFENVREG